MVSYIDSVECVFDAVSSDRGETELKRDRWGADLVLVVVLAHDLGPAPRVVVLDLGKLRLVVEEQERAPVLCAVFLNVQKNE